MVTSFKGESHSKEFTFLSLPIASTHSAFRLTDISASKVPLSILKEATSQAAILKLSWQLGRVYMYMTSFHLTFN